MNSSGETEGLKPGRTYDGPPIFSASQIATYLECPRKWAWDKIAHVPRSTHPSAALGTKTHAHLERWLTTGDAPPFTLPDGTEDPSAEFASVMLDELPPPMDPGLEVEKSFTLASPRTGFIYRGFIDWRHPAWSPPGTNWEPLPTVGDHKTTSDINRYAKTAQDLATDPQAIIYSVDTMAYYRAPRVRLQWTYTQTRGARKVLPVIAEFDSAHVASAFEVLEEVAGEMAQLLKSVGPEEIKDKIPPVPEHCNAYGGCPYRHKCALGPRDINPGLAPGQLFDFSR